VIIKERFSKKYRHPILDEKINSKRLLQEARNMVKARKLGVPVPALVHVDTFCNKLYIEKVQPGCMVKDLLHAFKELPPHLENDLAYKIGKTVALLHSNDCVHGDLTTSNMLLKPEYVLDESNISPLVFLTQPDLGTLVRDMQYFIDFGLSFVSKMHLDKAVDLYVLERAITSAHPNTEKLVRIS
jgi:TP53 regulating kinase and related kinases